MNIPPWCFFFRFVFLLLVVVGLYQDCTQGQLYQVSSTFLQRPWFDVYSWLILSIAPTTTITTTTTRPLICQASSNQTAATTMTATAYTWEILQLYEYSVNSPEGNCDFLHRVFADQYQRGFRDRNLKTLGRTSSQQVWPSSRLVVILMSLMRQRPAFKQSCRNKPP